MTSLVIFPSTQDDGSRTLIYVALGANLHGMAGGPRATLRCVTRFLAREAGKIVAHSNFYRTAPVPASGQPDYVNAVVALRSDLRPEELLAVLHKIEARLGRRRGVRNAPRTLDLDLIAYDDVTRDGAPILPHPRMQRRAFVLLPLAEIAPQWRHPQSGRTVRELIARLPTGQRAKPIRQESTTCEESD